MSNSLFHEDPNPLTIHFSGTEFEEMLYFVTESSKRGIGVLDSNLVDNNWSLGQSLLFTVTVVTTIGNFVCASENVFGPISAQFISRNSDQTSSFYSNAIEFHPRITIKIFRRFA